MSPTERGTGEPVRPGTLYVVATPIGNLGDMTRRAIEVLQGADCIAAEDTRHSGRLLRALGIGTPMISLHEFNEAERIEAILDRLGRGQAVALISDAGTPLISDPGFSLVRRARHQGLAVVPVPGPSAITAALSVAGLPTDRFVFEGFLPARQGARQGRLRELAGETRTLVFFEAPHRIHAAVEDMAAIFGESRPAVLARELSKAFESVHGDTLGDLPAWLDQDANRRRGEFVILVEGAPKREMEVDEASARVLDILHEELPLKQAAALASRITGVSRNRLYRHGLRRDVSPP